MAKNAAEYSSGGRKITSTSSGSSSTSGSPGMKPSSSPPTTSTIGYGMFERTRGRRQHRDRHEQADEDQLDARASGGLVADRRRRPQPRGSPRARAAGPTWPSTSDSVRNACVSATLPHSALRDLVRGPRRSATRPGSWRRAARASAKRSSISATWSVTGSPWPASTTSAGSSRVSRSESDVGHQRARAAAVRLARAAAERRARSAGWRRCGSIRWSPPISTRRSASQNSVSDGEWPGRCWTSQRAVGERQHRRRRRADGRPRALPPQPRIGARHRAQCDDRVARDAVAQHQRLRQLVVALGVGAELLQHRRQQVERADLGARAVGRGCRPGRGGRGAGA